MGSTHCSDSLIPTRCLMLDHFNLFLWYRPEADKACCPDESWGRAVIYPSDKQYRPLLNPNVAAKFTLWINRLTDYWDFWLLTTYCPFINSNHKNALQTILKCFLEWKTQRLLYKLPFLKTCFYRFPYVTSLMDSHLSLAHQENDTVFLVWLRWSYSLLWLVRIRDSCRSVDTDDRW